MVVFVQGILPFLTLVLSGVKSSLEENTIRMDTHVVENSQVILENDMVEKWRSVYRSSDELTADLLKILEKHGMTEEEFLSSDDVQQEYLSSVFPEMVDSLQYNTTSGLFLILANDQPTDEGAAYHGFFIRDSDPQNKTASNTDLLMERGAKKLSHSMSISLDSSWTTDFHFLGNGERDADDFFYQPYLAALAHKDSSMTALGEAVRFGKSRNGQSQDDYLFGPAEGEGYDLRDSWRRDFHGSSGRLFLGPGAG